MRVWHRRLSLFLLLPWVWIIGTGVMLSTMNFWRDSRAPFRLPAPAANLNAEAQLTASLLAMGNSAMNIKSIVFSNAELASLQVRLNDGTRWFFSPGKTEPVAKLDAEATWFIDGLTRLHRGKFAGLSGQIVFSLLGMGLLFVTLTGVGLFRVRMRLKNLRDWHRALGAITALPLFIFIASGSVLNLAQQLRQAPQGQDPPLVAPPLWQEAVRQARAMRPEPLRGVYKVSGHIMTEFTDGGRIYFPLPTLEPVVKLMPWTLRGWVEPAFSIHSGRIWGVPGRWLLLVSGALALLVAGMGGWLLRGRSRHSQKIQRTSF